MARLQYCNLQYVRGFMILLCSSFIWVKASSGWPLVESGGDCVVVKKIVHDFLSQRECNQTSQEDVVRLINSSSANIVQSLKHAFDDCELNNGLFRFTPVHRTCDFKLCNGQDECILGEDLRNDAVHFSKTDNDDHGIKLPDLNKYTNGSCTCQDTKFDPNWTGVIYSPYDKQKIPAPCGSETEDEGKPFCTVKWSNYTKEEFQAQMNLISSEFKQISLYGSGTVSGEKGRSLHWSQSKILSSRIPIYLAEMNKAAGFHRLQATVGIFRLPEPFDPAWVLQEKENALNLTLEANAIFSQSVWGISVQLNIHLDNPNFNLTKEIATVKEIMEDVKVKLREAHGGEQVVQVGLRIPDCQRTIVDESAGDRTEQWSAPFCHDGDIFCPAPLLLESYKDVVQTADFVICAVRPWLSPQPKDKLISGLVSMIKEVKKVGKWFMRIQSAMQRKLIGETGWASQGVTTYGSPNSIANMRNYWREMALWSKENQLKVYMFEAFDESWKIDNNPNNKKFNGLVCGSEAYFGWWKRWNNSVPAVYLEKENELKIPFEANRDPVESVDLPNECALTDSLETPDRSHFWNVSILFGGLVLVVIFIIVVTYMGLRLRRAQKSEAVLSRRYLEMFLHGVQSPGQSREGETDHYQIVALRFPYDKKKYELDRTQFQIDNSLVLGKGQCGTVYKGKILGEEDTVVAFKTTDAFSSIIDVKNLLSEIKIMSYIGEHENIVCLLGACTEKLEKGIVYVALEYCEMGSLDKYLLRIRTHYRPPTVVDTTISNNNNNSKYSTNPPVLSYVTTDFLKDPVMQSPPSSVSSSLEELDFTFDYLSQWAFEIADGMEFLASKKVVHADLASRNMLLSKTKSIKITDFGLSRKLYHELGETFDPEVPLPWRWMAPESLRCLTFSSETDAWSYGVTLWEIFSLGDIPFALSGFSNQFIVELENGLRLEKPVYASEEMFDIITKCWKRNPMERPTFTQIKQKFHNIVINKCIASDAATVENESTKYSNFQSLLTNQQLDSYQPIYKNKLKGKCSSGDLSSRYISPCFESDDYLNQSYLRDHQSF